MTPSVIFALLIAVAETSLDEAKSPPAILDFTIGTFRLLRDAFNLARRSGEIMGLFEEGEGV